MESSARRGNLSERENDILCMLADTQLRGGELDEGAAAAGEWRKSEENMGGEGGC